MKIYLSYFILLLACGKKESPNPSLNGKIELQNINISGPKVAIALGGNAYITANDANYSEKIDDSGSNGLTGWKSPSTTVSVYFKVLDTGTVHVFLRTKVDAGFSSEIKLLINGQSQTKKIANTSFDTVSIGNFSLKDKGYVKVDLQGVSKTGSNYGAVTDLIVQGSKVTNNMIYVRDNLSSHYYWGRRGPSVHLGYQQPVNFNSEWFYNEVTVPKGNDVIGSYFMTNGFAEGYFGIQVNSASERRILFSVWSPFQTDNPKDIPDDQKIVLLKKGSEVRTGEFGNEGAGGQSYLLYNWKPETTYRFLLQAKPTTNNYTIYTAYFFSPELNDWQLIASFSRPKTQTYLRNAHSFLENFSNTRGYLTRSAEYGNAWVRSETGVWSELNVAKFTGDDVAKINFRQDFAGGIRNGKFYLQNGGFFNENVTLGTSFTRPILNKIPIIDFNKLP